MHATAMLTRVLEPCLATLHTKRKQSLLRATAGLLRGGITSLSAIALNLSGTRKLKHRLKSVDRLLGNATLHQVRGDIYRRLAQCWLAPHEDRDGEPVPPSIIFHQASGVDEAAVAQVQATLRRRILRAFVGRGLLDSCDAKVMLGYQHSGFSVDAGVCIEAHDRAALERLLRYCARPPFALDRLRKAGAALVYRCAKQYSEPSSDKRGARVDELHLTPLELIDRIAALVPPPRTHRHRYFGVLAPNSPLRSAVTALAAPVQPATAGERAPAVAAPPDNALPTTPEPVPPKRAAAHYQWAVLIARIYEVFPLLCPLCGGQMRLIAFITHSADIRKILVHIGADSEPPPISPARGPPLWDDCGAQMDDGAQSEPQWDLAAQPAPDYEVDQRVNW